MRCRGPRANDVYPRRRVLFHRDETRVKSRVTDGDGEENERVICVRSEPSRLAMESVVRRLLLVGETVPTEQPRGCRGAGRG